MSTTAADTCRPYSLGEEIANAVTHGIGALLSAAGLAVLVVLSTLKGTAWHVVSTSVYGTTLVLLYLASTLYHGLPWSRVKLFFERLDHAAIFLLIAGTYTPFLLVAIRGPLGWSLFGVVWALALAGAVFKIAFPAGSRRISVAVYLLMGWLCLAAIRDLYLCLPRSGLIFLLLGGLAYTGGTVFYLWNRIPFNHAIWHLCVLLGSVLHFFSVLECVCS